MAKQRHRTAIDFYVATILGAAFLFGCTHPKALPDGVMWALLTALAAIGGVGSYLNRKGRGDLSAVLCIASSAKHGLAAAGAWLIRHNGGPFIAALLMLAGCVSDLPSPATIRIALNKQAEAMNRLGPALVAACSPQPQPAWCVDAGEAFDAIAQAHKLEQDFVDVYTVVAQ